MGEDGKVEVATFACGCFWSKEYFLQQQEGVLSTRVGFTGGHLDHPSYRQVCTKATGHAEAVEVTFDPQKTSFQALAIFFFNMHDPTIDRRSKGGQYRSAIFAHSTSQKKIAEALREQLCTQGYDVVTQIEMASTFWPAEDRHQNYCAVRGFTPELRLTERLA